MNPNELRAQTIALAKAKPHVKRRIINCMTYQDMLDTDAEYERWIHEGQMEPAGDGWRTWLMMAGRGFGKTRAGAEWIEKIARSRPGVRIALVGATIDEARRVMVEGVSGVLSVAKRRRHRVKWEPSVGRLRWPNGSEAQLFSGDNPDGLRGPEHDFAWVLTFEVIADPVPVSIGSILADCSEGTIASPTTPAIRGYAAYGSSVAAAVEPLVEAFAVPLVDNGSVLSPAIQESVTVAEEDFGCTADQRQSARISRSQSPAATLPSALTLSYYDPARDYQTGVARASLDRRSATLETLEMPGVLEAAEAKALAETCLARQWAQRDKVTLRLSPAYLDIQPGMQVSLNGAADLWRVERLTLDAMVTVAELRPVYSAIDTVPADQGRVLPSTPIKRVPTDLALFELPDGGSGGAGGPVVVAAAGGGPGWRPVPLVVEIGGAQMTARTARAATVMGTAATVLGQGQSELLDLCNSVDVSLTDAGQWLESRDDDALRGGANLAILGDEIFQFGSALPLGDGLFRLTRLLRGRRGTEWAMGTHAPGDRFAILDPAHLLRLPLDRGSISGRLRVTPAGLADEDAVPVERVIAGEALKPPSPVHLRAWMDAEGNLNCTWIRRSASGWDWLDAVDAPLGCATELYRVTLESSLGSISWEGSVTSVQFSAAQLSGVGSGPAELSVVQVGDFATSRPGTVSITIE